MSLWGSWRMISLSLQVPGSDSSAFTTRYDGLPSDACKMIVQMFSNQSDMLRPPIWCLQHYS